MARKRKPETLDREKNMAIALMGLRNGRWKSVGKAARDMNVPQESLRRQWKGGMSRVEAREKQQKLTKPEEKVLANWITRLTATGHPARHEFIREMAEEIRNKRAEENQPHLSIPLGKSWVQQFIGRHPHLKTVISRSIEASRIKALTKKVVESFFDALEACLQEYQIEWQNVYNMDETGKLLDTLN